jgi:hypothetical protein
LRLKDNYEKIIEYTIGISWLVWGIGIELTIIKPKKK